MDVCPPNSEIYIIKVWIYYRAGIISDKEQNLENKRYYANIVVILLCQVEVMTMVMMIC
jgi:hypothetical protein